MLLVLLALAGAVAVLWKRLSDVTAQQAALTREHRALRAELTTLETQLRTLTRDATGVPSAPRAPAAPLPVPAGPPVSTPTPEPPPIRPSRSSEPSAPAPRVAVPSLPAAGRVTARETAATSRPAPDADSLATSSRWALEFFTTGNVVAKVGMVIVFFGVA